MDFRFNEEQQMTAEAVRSLLADLCQPSDLRRLMQSGAARDETRWRKLVEMGLQGALVPEDKGGLGLSAADFVLVAEACGYACLPEPLVENAGVALPMLAALSEDTRCAEALERALGGEITIALQHPANLFVADADTSGAILIARDGDLHLVTSADVTLTRQPSMDPFRRLFSIAGPLPADSRIGVEADLGAVLDRGALFTAAQTLGIAQHAVDLAVDYAKSRNQFGKPIGTYQAVKHLLATVQVKIEFARPVVYAGAAGLENFDIYSRARISHAKLAAAEAADLACRTAIQVHGAMGYSWEVDVHFFLKRTLALTNWWGDTKFHRDRVAARVFERPLGADRTFATENPGIMETL
jgi:alkylation response protein AidB-like acyl-CoA dehydrogenase